MTKILSQGLHPMTLVDYKREPFIYAPGNVRVTIDYDIRTGLRCTDLLNTESSGEKTDFAGAFRRRGV